MTPARFLMVTIILVNIHISRGISIEHPGVGLDSLAQLYIVRANFVLLTRKEGGMNEKLKAKRAS